MALTKCKECGHEVSSNAKSCPHCGKPLGMSLQDKASAWATLTVIVFVGWIVYTCNHADAPPAAASIATVSPNATSAAPHNGYQLTAEERGGCEEYGKVAGNLAADRDNGVPLADQLTVIKTRLGDTPLAKEMRDLAKLLYSNQPAFRSLSQRGATTAFMMDCQTRIIKTKGGSKTFASAENISAALKDFKTFNGTPFVELVVAYGVKIASVEATPTAAFGDGLGKPGDIDFTLTFARGATKKMPCHLERWMRGESLPIIEFTRSASDFPEIKADQDDPLEYWAATGKCSDAFSY